MSEVTIKTTDLREGDVIVRWNYLSNNEVVVQRSAPDPNKFYTHWGGFGATHVIAENGRGYWHAYKQVESQGLYWQQFVEKFSINPDELKVFGRKEEENV